MSIKDLEVELNKIEGHSGNKWNNLADSIAKKELYERAWCITCDNKIVETQAHFTTCRSYEVKWQKIELQVSQILWNSLEQNLQRKISLEKLTSWLYSKTQDQKEAIREEIIRNLTRKKTKKTLYEACRKNNTVQQVLILWLDLSWNLFYENIWKPRCEMVIAWKKNIGIGRKAKQEFKSRLTEVRSKRILKQRKKAPKLERLEDKEAPSSNTSSQEEKKWEMDQLHLECLEKFITKG
ncbi:42136_t:CDS:2, partial [Gigaspora margarita]